MCGIAVAVGWPDAAAVVERLAQGIRHRGEVTDPLVSPTPSTAFCTRRLRIVDAERGRQPALSPDGRILLAFNGEIYNFEDLRRELEAQGVRFSTASDTEVLAAAVAAWGAAALPRLVGMFAFVALDLRTGEFLAARDPMGVKPLYLIQSAEGFLFCSEIAPLLAATDEGEVLFLPPGHLLTRTACAPYPTVFSHAIPPQTPSPERLDALLQAAVESRLPRDLPFALMFSGGIDSTLVAHYARRTRAEAPGYFLGDTTAPDYVFAARYAERAGMDLRLVPLPAPDDDPEPWIDRVIEATESFEPGTVRGGLCNYVLSRRIHADGFKVTLCGDGADELFAGYRVSELGYAASQEIGEVIRNQCLALMSRDNLQALDRCSMRFQLEAREPFLDPSIIRYAMGCDRGALLEAVGGDVRGKAPLREIYDRHPAHLPQDIRARSKLPFNEGCGFDRTLRDAPWTRYAESVLSDSDLRDGAAELAAYSVTTKEELLYIRKLAARLDIARVPSLKGRPFLNVPRFAGDEQLRAYNLLEP